MSSNRQPHPYQTDRRSAGTRTPQTIPANAFPALNVLPGYGHQSSAPPPDYTPVPLSHPPLLAELQSQSHRFSPAGRRRNHSRTPSTHGNQGGGVNASIVPTHVLPQPTLSPVSTPTSPIPHQATALPLVNVLNLNTLQESPGNSFQGGTNSPSPVPMAFGGGASGSFSSFPAPTTIPPNSFSLSQSLDHSGFVIDKIAETESFVPAELQSESNPLLVGELEETPKYAEDDDGVPHTESATSKTVKKSSAEVPQHPSSSSPKKPRVLTRVVEEPWTQVFPAKEVTITSLEKGVVLEGEDSLPASIPQLCPEARFGHVAVVRDSVSEMVVFGGRQTGICYDDLWVADLESVQPLNNGSSTAGSKTIRWRKINKKSSTSTWPSPRAGHTASINAAGTEMLVFGGGTENEFYGQLYSFSFESEEWTLLTDFCKDVNQRNYDAQVRPRKGHTSVWDEEEQALYVYGGMLSVDEPEKDSTIWRYDRRGNSWAPMPSSGQQPPDRMYHVAGYDEHNKQMYVFGGRTISSTPGYPFLGDLFCFDMKTCVWSKLETQQSGSSRDVIEAPKPRMCAASLFHNGRFYISHGGHTRYLNDSFEYDVRQKKWLRSAPTPTPLTRPTVVLHRDSIVCFGGCDHEIFVNDCHRMKLVQPTLFELCAEWLNNEAEVIPARASSSSIRTLRHAYADPLNNSLSSFATAGASSRDSTATIPAIVLPPPVERDDEPKLQRAQDLLPSNVLQKAQQLLSEQRVLPAKDPVVHVQTQHFF